MVLVDVRALLSIFDLKVKTNLTERLGGGAEKQRVHGSIPGRQNVKSVLVVEGSARRNL